jgi:hypothetical protein
MVLPNMTMFSLYLYFRTYRRSPPAYQSDSDYYKVYYWYEVPDGYRQKVTRGTREDVAQATAPRQYEKFVQILWARYKLRQYTHQTLQRPRTSTSKDMSDIQRSDVIYTTPRTHGIKKMWTICWMFRKSNRSLRIFRMWRDLEEMESNRRGKETGYFQNSLSSTFPGNYISRTLETDLANFLLKLQGKSKILRSRLSLRNGSKRS